jgi:ABC-type transport system involved in Fe-S cluster assembly fused permease/ATPase subunit
MDFHTNKDSGEVLKSVDQAHALNDLMEMVLFDIGPVFIDLIVAMWYVTHLFDIYLAFIVLVVGVVYIWLGITMTAWAQPLRRVYVEKARNESKTVYELVPNWQTVSYFNRAPYERDRYSKAVQTKINARWAFIFRWYAGHASQALVMDVGFCACSLLAVWEISSGRKPIGNFVTFITYWGTMVRPLYTMANSYRHISSTLIDAERLLQLLTTKPSVVEPDVPKQLVVKAGKVEFENVEFSYDTRKNVLKGINFVAEPGKTVAFVGETGGGKSTLLKLLFRFYDVTNGSIKIDDQDLRSVSITSLRDAFGIVPQDPALFNQTILENIRYAKLDATDEEIQEACKAAAVHDKIMTFPDQYKSKVGERGVKLSGGELQRVAIARVLIKNPRIVMLDEATSAVDSSTEAQIQAAFQRLSKGRTTFVVAHRLSTIMEADLILVIDQGEIVERGTHDELLQKGGKYLELWTKQTAVRKHSKANSEADKDDVLINDLPGETYSEELAKSFGVGVEQGDVSAGNEGERQDPALDDSSTADDAKTQESTDPTKDETEEAALAAKDDDENDSETTPLLALTPKPTIDHAAESSKRT